MDTSWPIAAWFTAIRAFHMGACLLMLGICIFDSFIATPVLRDLAASAKKKWSVTTGVVVTLSLFIALLTGIAWLILTAAQMSDLSLSEAARFSVLHLVWTQTQFGQLWQFRTALWLGTSLFILSSTLPIPLLQILSRYTATLFAAALAASLAWAGHGQTGPHPGIHLPMDILHLLATALWPMNLVPFILLLMQLRQLPAGQRATSIPILIARFSAMSLCTVSVLTVSGAANTYFLVGSFPLLFHTPYGQLLLLKLFFFAIAIIFSAYNLLYLKPRLVVSSDNPAAATRLQMNIICVIFLATLAMLAVGLLGQLPPPFKN